MPERSPLQMSETNYLGQQEGEHSFVLTARMMSAGLTHVNVHVTVTGGGPSDREQCYRVTADDREGNGSAAVKHERGVT